MRKAIFLVFMFIIFLNYNSTYGSIFGGSNTYDIYGSVAETTITQDKDFLMEFLTDLGNSSIKDELNIEIDLVNTFRDEGKELEKFKEDFTLEELKDIVNGINAQKILMEKLKIDSIEIGADFGSYYTILSDFYNLAIISSQDMSENVQSIRNVARYMDGNENNAPYDLIINLEKINDVIFKNPFYYPGNDPDFKNYVRSGNDDDKNNQEDDPIEGGDDEEDNNFGPNGLSQSENKMLESQGLIEVCPIEGNVVFRDQEKDKENKKNENNENLKDFIIDNLDSLDLEFDRIEDYIYNLFQDKKGCLFDNDIKKIEDKLGSSLDIEVNTCIEKEHDFYQQSFFGGAGPSSGKKWFTSKTIEDVIDESIANLGKIINKSFIQSEMSANNFELGLKNFNLPDIFNVGFQIIRKPVPIKRGTPKTKEPEKDDYYVDNYIENLYRDLGFDPNRINNINNIKNHPALSMVKNNSTQLSTINFQQRMSNIYNEEVQDIELKNSVRDIGLQSKIRNEIYGDFLGQFSELEKFTNGLIRYGEDYNTIIKGMNRIPINE